MWLLLADKVDAAEIGKAISAVDPFLTLLWYLFDKYGSNAVSLIVWIVILRWAKPWAELIVNTHIKNINLVGEKVVTLETKLDKMVLTQSEHGEMLASVHRKIKDF